MNSTCRLWCLFKSYRQCCVKPLDVSVLLRNTKQTSVLQEPKRFITLNDGVELNSNQDTYINDLANGDPTLEKKLKVLFLEVDIWRQEGGLIPSCISTNNWKELMTLETRTARKKYLTFCFKREMKKNNEKKKKDAAKSAFLEETKKITNDITQYGLGSNTLFMRIRDSTINNFLNGKLIEAMQFSQRIVVDCGYDSHMTRREARNCGKQLMLLFSENRSHSNPFNLYFCNAKKESWTMQEFIKSVPTAYEPHFPLNITEKCYLDLFPKERLVYLTPHCREELLNYDHDAVYIIGGIVDKVNNKPVSLARAKEQGLKMAKLPLDRYLSWASGSGKSLTLNQMIMIMLDIRHSGDWNRALKHVPTRKVEKVYKVDYTADRFKLIENNNKIQQKREEKYNQLKLKS